jgi:hypothetical protein
MIDKNQEIQEIKEKLEFAEKELVYLNKADKMRENWEKMVCEIRNIHAYYNRKIIEMEKQMNKIK